MKTEEEIRGLLKDIEADEKLHYPAANVQVNAPLALIQMGLESQRSTLEWILKDE